MSTKLYYLKVTGKIVLSASFVLSSILTPFAPVAAATSVTPKDPLPSLDEAMDAVSDGLSQSHFSHVEEREGTPIQGMDVDPELSEVILHLETSRAFVVPGREVEIHWRLEGWEELSGVEGLTLLLLVPEAFSLSEDDLGEFEREAHAYELPLTSPQGSVLWSVQRGAEGPFHIQAMALHNDLVMAEARLTLESILGLSNLQPIRSQGRLLEALGGRVRLNFPQGAVRETLIARIYDVGDGALLPIKKGERITEPLNRHGIPSLSGKPFELLAFSLFGKQVTRFNQSVEIQIHYEDDEVQGDEGSLTLFTFDEEENTWVPLPSMVDTENNLLTGWTDHFSLFDFNIQDWEAARLPSVAGFQVSTFTGAGTYSYPIQVPPGPGGLQPSLSLSYNSQVVDSANSRTQASWVGMGWSLETGYIQRNMNGTAFYEGDDTFTLHVNGTGNLLLPVGEGTDGIGDYIEYHPVEENFWRIRHYPEVGSGGYAIDISQWQIWDGEGNHYLFNAGPTYPDYKDYRIDLMRCWQWPLTRVTNRFGQSLTYSYETEYKVTKRCDTCDQAYHQTAVDPSTITYPNNRYRIRFVRMGRADYENHWANYATSFVLFQRSLLSELLVEHDSDGDGTFEQVIRKYVFTYETDPEKLVFPNVSWSAGGKTPTLAQVQEFGLNGESLPPTTFEYGDNMHLTRGDNGYGGKVEFVYEPWNGSESPDEGEMAGWSPPKQIWEELSVDSLQTEVYHPGETYHLWVQVNAGGWNWVQVGLNSGATNQRTDQMPALAGDWQWQHFETTFRLPPTASKALPLFNCNACTINQYKMKLLPTRYRVTEKRVYDGFDPIPTAFTYGYDGPAMNDPAHSNAAASSAPYFKAHTEFRGHERAWEQDPGGAIRTTWFHQDDLLKGRPLRTQVTDANGNIFLETETQYATDPQALGALPKKENGTVYTGFSINWIRALESISRTYEGDETWIGTRVEYGYDPSLQGLRQFGNLTDVREYSWNGVAWSLYRSSQTRYYPNTWYGRYLVGLPAKTMAFDASGNPLSETRYHYDGNTGYSALPTNGILTAHRKWIDSNDGNRRYQDEVYTYDTWGNPTSVTSYTGYGTESMLAATGAQTARTTFDATYHTYTVEIRNDLNQITSIDYDYALGLPVRETDPNGATITASYDGLGRLTSLRRPGDESGTPSVGISYTDSLPYIVEIRQKVDGSNTQVWQRYYDGLGQLIQSQTVGAQLEEGLRDIVVDYAYDENGRVIQETVPYALSAGGGFRGQQLDQPSIRTSYDLLGRALIVTAPDGNVETLVYDDLEVCTADSRGNTTTQVSDVWGRTVEVIPSTGPGVRYVYDEPDRLMQATKGSGASATSITMTYDIGGRKLEMVDPDMGHWTYSYDALGNLITQTDARGETLWFAYDDLNRLIEKRHGGSNGDLLVSYAYDEGGHGIGRRTSMVDATGSTTWSYDLRGRLVDEIKHITGAGTFLTQWSYNAADMITSMTYPGGNAGQTGEQVNYGYHPQGALNSVSSSEGVYLQSSGYDAAGRLVSRTLGDNLLNLDYDFYPWTTVNGQGRLEWITAGTSSLPEGFQKLHYDYDPNGNITRIEDWVAGAPQAQVFNYDELNRLLSADVTGGIEGLYSEGYAYDPATGNLSEKGGVAYAYDPSHPHAVTHLDGEQRFTYDSNGGMIGRVVDQSKVQTLYYDADNRLIGVDIEEVIPEPTPTASSTPTETPTSTPTETPSSTPEGGETATPTLESTSTPMPEPSNTPTASLEPSQTPEPSLTIAPTETIEPTTVFTASSTSEPTATFTLTETPTPTPTFTPTMTFIPTGTPTPPYHQIRVGSNVVKHSECDWNIEFNYTVEEGEDRLLVVAFIYRRDQHQGVWGVSYNGIGLIKAIDRSDPGGDHAIAHLWYLPDPPVGTYKVSIGLNTASVLAGAYTLYGVDLSNPLVGVMGDGAYRDATALTLSANPGDMAVSIIGANGTHGVGLGWNQVTHWDHSVGGKDWGMHANSSTEGSQGSRVIMSYGLGYARDFVHAAAVFRARQGLRPTSTPIPTNTYTPLPTSTPTITNTPTPTATLSSMPEVGSGLVGEYYDNMDLTYLKVVRTDPAVNFDWGGGSPDPSLGADTYSIRWRGRVRASYSETYTFYVRSDDGARLWVNGQLIIDQWSDHAPAEYSGSAALSADQRYDIRLEYYENTQGAIVELRWSSPSQAKGIIPQSALYPPNPLLTPTGTPANGSGLEGEYYDNANLTDLELTRIDQTVNFDWGRGAPDPAIGADTFSVRWVGKVLPKFAETYTFYVRSDDGARLWVDGMLIIDQWTDHGVKEYSGSISLTAGKLYDITLEYYENGLDAIVQLSWSSRTQAKQIIPQSQLFPAGYDFTPTVIPSPTNTPTPLPTGTSTPTPTIAPTETPVLTATPIPSETSTLEASLTPTTQPTSTSTPTPAPTEPLPPSPHNANFYYDGDGNRVLSIVDGVARVYIGDYYEYELGTGITRRYYGSGSAMRIANATDPEENDVFYLLKDHLGSTNLTLDSAGDLVSEMRYSAWGETRYTSGTTPTDFGYTGQRQEIGLGFYYYKARWYDPALGRFLQADSIIVELGNPMALDRYAYAYNNPFAYTDSSGHSPCGDKPYCPGDWFDSRLIDYGIYSDPDNWDPGQQERNQKMVAQGTGIFLDFAPFFGDIKGFIEVFTGVDMATDEELGVLRLLGLFGISELRHLRHGDELLKARILKELNLPEQAHHIFSHINRKWTPIFQEITQKYGLDLDEAWNIIVLPHRGRHADAYHKWVWNTLLEIDKVAKGDKKIFLDQFNERIVKSINENPLKLRRIWYELFQ